MGSRKTKGALQQWYHLVNLWEIGKSRSIGWKRRRKRSGGRGHRYRKCFGMGMHLGVEKAQYLQKLCNIKGRSREAGHKRIFTMLLQRGRKKKALFLLLPRLSAWEESLYVDHGLPSEDALAVVDRDRVCDGSHSYSTETVKGGAMRGSRLSSLVFLLTLLTVFTLSTLTSKGMQSW